MVTGESTLAGRELAVAAGRRALLRGERVDMRALARELQIARATLYRWCGDRDALLGDVLWSLSSNALEQAAAKAPGHGLEHFLGTMERFMTQLVSHQPFRRFILAEPETASRVLM